MKNGFLKLKFVILLFLFKEEKKECSCVKNNTLRSAADFLVQNISDFDLCRDKQASFLFF